MRSFAALFGAIAVACLLTGCRKIGGPPAPDGLRKVAFTSQDVYILIPDDYYYDYAGGDAIVVAPSLHAPFAARFEMVDLSHLTEDGAIPEGTAEDFIRISAAAAGKQPTMVNGKLLYRDSHLERHDDRTYKALDWYFSQGNRAFHVFTIIRDSSTQSAGGMKFKEKVTAMVNSVTEF